MSQSGAVALFLLAGFIVFITVRGELPQYLDVIGLAPKASQSLQSQIQWN